MNERVFRRNVKNLILLWSSRNITDDQRENMRIYTVEAETYREISWKPFVPDQPDKFSPDVVGVVISHSNNAIDPSEPCTIRIMLGTGNNVIEIEKEVLPASQAGPADPPVPRATLAAATERTINVRLYVLDEEANHWVPVSTGSLPALKCDTILLKENS